MVVSARTHHPEWVCFCDLVPSRSWFLSRSFARRLGITTRRCRVVGLFLLFCDSSVVPFEVLRGPQDHCSRCSQWFRFCNSLCFDLGALSQAFILARRRQSIFFLSPFVPPCLCGFSSPCPPHAQNERKQGIARCGTPRNLHLAIEICLDRGGARSLHFPCGISLRLIHIFGGYDIERQFRTFSSDRGRHHLSSHPRTSFILGRHGQRVVRLERFNKAAMKVRLPKPVYKSLVQTIETGVAALTRRSPIASRRR